MNEPTDQANQYVAAVDLGSNSFHMIVAELVGERLKIIDRLREMVRLAAGLDKGNRLSETVMVRALDCLQRFSQRLRRIPQGNVRVVGTNTLRKARNREKFLLRAQQAIKHPIDIIAGHEEARLIYLGVAHSLEDGSERRLVIDIGGGSTELILGKHFKPQCVESLHMGCVGMSQRFFRDGIIDERRMGAAEIAALQELETLEALYKRIGWESAIGASGTILTIRDLVTTYGWSKDGITAPGLRKLRKALSEAGHVDNLKLDGLQKERAPVFPGGVAILSATFESLGIEHMRVSEGALREGLLYDLLGRIHQEDVRERTVNELATRYGVNTAQAERVRATALILYSQVAGSWDLEDKQWACLLRWAAGLHEIGMAISHSQYHKHGAYLLKHLDMPGFARGEQTLLGLMVRGHRRRFPLAQFKELPKQVQRTARRLCLLLRLAVLLHRSRTEQALPPIRIAVDDPSLAVRFPERWLDERPLTRADLEQEVIYLKKAEVKLRFS